MTETKMTALVTGASSGLGREYCRQLAQRCQVIIAVARNGAALEELAEQLAPRCEVHCITADLASIEGRARTLEALRQRGPADILVNNAGFATMGTTESQEATDQLGMMAVHMEASVALCRAAVPFMRERGGGSIINISSLVSFLPMAQTAVYGASKAFLNVFSLALQSEVAADGIDVQCLCPGYTRTGFHATQGMAGFDPGQIPDKVWMDSESVVRASLEALGSGAVLVVPGEGNGELARQGLQGMLKNLATAG